MLKRYLESFLKCKAVHYQFTISVMVTFKSENMENLTSQFSFSLNVWENEKTFTHGKCHQVCPCQPGKCNISQLPQVHLEIYIKKSMFNLLQSFQMKSEIYWYMKHKRKRISHFVSY